MAFKMRTTKPEAGNKYYIRKANGGYSNAIAGSPTDKNCNVLSNCVGYAYGRFNEIGGYGYCKYLAPVNAENFIQYKGSCKVGQTPKVGACMVWQKGATLSNSDGAGHVAIVEKVVSATEVITSESAWGGAAFFTKTRKKGSDGRWGCGSAYKFLGFIYNPAKCCTEEPKPTPKVEPVSKFKAGDTVSIKSGATYYGMTKKVPSWVLAKKWVVKSVSGSRVVVDKSSDGSSSICSPIDAKYLTIVNTSSKPLPVKVNSVVSIKKGASYYNSTKKVPSWVLAKKWVVKSVSGSRAVIDKSTDGSSAICSPIDIKYLTVIK